MFKPFPGNRYARSRSIAGYKTSWSRKHGLIRILPRLKTKVTPTSIGRLPHTKVFRIKLALLNAGAGYRGDHRSCKSFGRTFKGAQKVAAQVDSLKRRRRWITDMQSQNTVEPLNLPVCETCGLMYQDLFTCALVPTGFLLYDSTRNRDVWDLDSCDHASCPHKREQS